jgi:protoheme IX farnesyltransferase
MNGAGAAAATRSASPARNHPRDLWTLTKPRITLMVLVTAAAGYFLAAGGRPEAPAMLTALFGIGLVAAGTSGLNQVWERDIDARMKRTRRRPIPAGRVSPRAGWVFTGLLAFVGVVFLQLLVDPLTAVLAALSVLSYVLVYTPLKRVSSLSTLVGAVPGALPIMGGWTAARGELGPGAWALFGILFFWQLPHFLALAWLFREDYQRGGLKMLGVDDPDARQTRVHSVLYASALLPASLFPVAIGLSGWGYLVVALAMGVAYCWAAIRFWVRADVNSARGLFRVSLLYLPVLLLALSVDRGPYPGTPSDVAVDEADAVTLTATVPRPPV